MGVWYTNRAALKAALTLPATSTGQDAALDAVLETVSREIDQYAGFGFSPVSGVRDYSPRSADCHYLDYPLTAVDSVAADNDANASYETAISATCYYLEPVNATMSQRPYWELSIRSNSTAVFPAGIEHGLRITGTWGYYDQRHSATGNITAAMTSAALTMTVAGASQYSAGHLFLVESERVQVGDVSTTAGPASGGVLNVLRARNGTVAAAHSSGTSFQVYDFPIVERAALYQAELDYRVKDAPMGMAGADAFGTQSPQPGGGLHPFTRRMLEAFRQPGAY